MAASTLTYTTNMSVAKALHVGLNTIPFDFNSGASKIGTLSDVIILGKVPNGALITDCDVRMGVSGAAAIHWALVLLGTDALGTFTTVATLIASMTASTAAQTFNSRIPVKVSLSDDRAVQYVVLALNCTTGASGTVSQSIQGSVKYLSDGSNV
jgi:hypothetical protein